MTLRRLQGCELEGKGADRDAGEVIDCCQFVGFPGNDNACGRSQMASASFIMARLARQMPVGAGGSLGVGVTNSTTP